MERGFGFDFGQVRIHDDARAAESARAENALAYTFGADITLDSSRSTPGSPSHQRLLAHELAHVVQQSKGGAALQRKEGDEPEAESEPASASAQQGASAQSSEPDTGLRQSKKCYGTRAALPLTESFPATTTAELFSPPFHAPKGTKIAITLNAELAASGDPTLASVGVHVFQCCPFGDALLTPEQAIGDVGDPNNPRPLRTPLSLELPDKCRFSTRQEPPDKNEKPDQEDHFVYYLRLYIASSAQAVILSYSVR